MGRRFGASIGFGIWAEAMLKQHDVTARMAPNATALARWAFPENAKAIRVVVIGFYAWQSSKSASLLVVTSVEIIIGFGFLRRSR